MNVSFSCAYVCLCVHIHSGLFMSAVEWTFMFLTSCRRPFLLGHLVEKVSFKNVRLMHSDTFFFPTECTNSFENISQCACVARPCRSLYNTSDLTSSFLVCLGFAWLRASQGSYTVLPSTNSLFCVCTGAYFIWGLLVQTSTCRRLLVLTSIWEMHLQDTDEKGGI